MADSLEYTPDLYTLVDEEGVEQTFELIDSMEIEDVRYFALVPYYPEPSEMLDSDGELVILKAESNETEEMLVSIDDEEEFNRIGEIFLQRIESMFEDEECDDDECCCDDDCDCDEDGCDCGEDDCDCKDDCCGKE